jgi:hypothetical protein
VPRVKFALRSSLEVVYLGLLAWVLLRERACVGASGELLPARNPTLHATLCTGRLQACVQPCVPEAVTPCGPGCELDASNLSQASCCSRPT